MRRQRYSLGEAASDTGKSRCRCKALTRGCYHALPLLEEAGLETVTGAEAVGLVAGHELLHGLEYHTELGRDQLVACQGTDVEWRPNGMGQKLGDQRLTRR